MSKLDSVYIPTKFHELKGKKKIDIKTKTNKQTKRNKNLDMLSQFHCKCCAIEQFAIVLKVLSDLLMFSFKLFKAQSLFYPPGVSQWGIIMVFRGNEWGCQSSLTKFKGDYGKLTANERERGRIIKHLGSSRGRRGGGEGAMVNFTLMS